MRDAGSVSSDSRWFRYDAVTRRLSLTLHVQPNARRSEIAGPHGGALKVRIAAPATDNRANAELVKFLSETLAIQKSAITIRHGASARRKVVDIAGGPELLAQVAKLK